MGSTDLLLSLSLRACRGLTADPFGACQRCLRGSVLDCLVCERDGFGVAER